MPIYSRLSIIIACMLFSAIVSAANITGAGATFPFPLYAKWAEIYFTQTGNKVNYQSIGSGGGIKQITAYTVDFGASDMPLKPDELDKKQLIQFPVVLGGVVPVINLPGVIQGAIKLTPTLLADIFLGKIKNWNDPALKKVNPSVNLPSKNIIVVRRADGSGTTFIFTHYLSSVSPQWAKEVGDDTVVKWPTGLGGKGNEGVANFVKKMTGSIGYVEYIYAKQNNMTYVQLQNASGQFVSPSAASFNAAAAHADWNKTPGYYLLLTNQTGANSWPITGATFVLMHKVQQNTVQATATLKFFDWAYTHGNASAQSMDYIPMPDAVKQSIRASWKHIKGSRQQAVWPAH